MCTSAIRDQLFLSGYFGQDVFSFTSADAGFSTRIPWGNAMGSLRWNRIVNDKMFLNVGTTYSSYEFAFIAGQEEFEFGFESGIKDWASRAELSWYPNLRHSIKTGIDYVHHDFIPTDFTARSGDTEFDTGESEQTFSHETGIYLQDDFDLDRAPPDSRWSALVGILARWTVYPLWHTKPFGAYRNRSPHLFCSW